MKPNAQVADPDRIYWDDHVRQGREARERRDGAQWTLGDLAASVETTYGDASIQKYAEEVGIPYDTLRRYRDVARRFPESARHRALSFGHHQSVASLDDPAPWLRMAAHGGWSVSRLREEIERTRREAEELARAAATESSREDEATVNEPVRIEKTREAVAARRQEIARLNQQGYRREDIARKVGISEQSVTNTLGDLGLKSVNVQIGKTRRIDPNRVIEGLVSGVIVPETTLDLMADAWSDLDRESLEGWIASLGESISMLRRVRTRLVEEMNRDQE